ILPACLSHQDGGRRMVGGRPKYATHGSFSPSEDFRMKKFVVTLLVGACALTVCLGSAQARPSYPGMIAEHYKDNKAIVEKSMSMKDKCFICHDSASTMKKDRNEFGVALSKHMTKAE